VERDEGVLPHRPEVRAGWERCSIAAVDALGALPDHAYAERLDPELREALTVGRPIAEA
jgi:hypothetical protein